LDLTIDVAFLHLEQQLFVIGYSLKHRLDLLVDFAGLLLILGILGVSFVEGVEHHTQEFPGFDGKVVVDVDVGVHEKFDLGHCCYILEFLH
jgi:hypothetical protein